MIVITTKDFERVNRALAELPEKAKKAVSMAINSAIRKGRTTVWREITAKYTVKRGPVYEAISQKFASPGGLYGAIEAVGAGIPIRDFRVRPSSPQPRRKPVITVEIVRGGAKPFPGGFVVGAFGSHVFTRRTQSRFPIEKRISTSVPQMMLGERAGETIKTAIVEHFNKEADRHITRALGGK